MSWRDGMQFEKWWSKYTATPAAAGYTMLPGGAVEMIKEMAREAYAQGYYDGAEAGANYDPRWDAD